MRGKATSHRTQRPYAAAVSQVVLVPVVVVVGLVAGVEWRWVIAVVLSFGLVAAVEPVRAVMELGSRRREADEWLLWGAVARPSSPLLSWRAAELTSRGRRSRLAHCLRRVDRDAQGDSVAAAVPLNRRSIRRNLGLVRALHQRLDDHSLPADPRGILLVERLVTVPRSPLYARVPDEVLAEALREALAALDPAPLAHAA